MSGHWQWTIKNIVPSWDRNRKGLSISCSCGKTWEK